MLKGLGILFVCIAIVVASIEFLGYSSCEPPIVNNSEQSQNNQPDKKYCSSPYAAFETGVSVSWNFLHESHDEILAIATIFIAIYTIVLGTATNALVRESRSATARQLRAYVGIERIYIESTNVDNANYEIPDPIPEGYIYRDLVRVKVKNFGGTPATVLTVIVNWQDMIPLGSGPV